MAGLYPALEELINRTLGRDDVAFSIFSANILQDKLYKNVKRKTGERAVFPFAKRRTGTAKNFTFYGATDTATYNQQVDAIEMLDMEWTNTADFLRISNVQAAMAAGPEALIRFIEDQIEVVSRSLREKISETIFNGSGTPPDGPGLSVALSYSTTYGGKTRIPVGANDEYRALLPVFVDANDVQQFNGSSVGTLTFTIGSNVVTPGTGNFTGWYPGGSVTAPDGNTYRVVSVGATVLLERNYTGSTITSSSWQYNGFFYPASTYGNAGEFTLKKLNKVMAYCTQGAETPTDIVCSATAYTALLNTVVDKGLYPFNEAVYELGVRKIGILQYNGADMYIDTHVPGNDVFILNLDYVNLAALKGYDKPQLAKTGLAKDTSGTRIDSLVGEVVATYALGVPGANRCGRITGISG